VFVVTEEFTNLRKSKPVIVVAGIIWILIGYYCAKHNISEKATYAVKRHILEFAELFMFLLVAMTYVNAMEERLVFDSLRAWLVRKNLNYRQLFWVTGLLSFIISPIADNLTTALLMCAVVMALAGNNKKFVSLACVNIVVAANAGGAFSPFGDITTLMVWQKGKLDFTSFFNILIPSIVAFIIPAIFMHFSVEKKYPESKTERIIMKMGAKRVVFLFILTIITAIFFHNFLYLPPMLGMMTGLGYLNFFAYYLKRQESKIMRVQLQDTPSASMDTITAALPFDIFEKIKRAEWDTLFFFYGVILSVGGLATLGYLNLASETFYNDWGTSLTSAYHATPANILVGLFSAIVDNIPVMFAVLTMNPTMSEGQWLLVTLTAGIGGSLLSIGSAAGVALMGQSKGRYTFFSHLRWTPAIFLGFALSIITHMLLNRVLF
jgi:NhaD family Na+/H+ antiporter